MTVAALLESTLIDPLPLLKSLGIALVSASDKESTVQLPFTEALCGHLGAMHPAALHAALEAAALAVAYSLLPPSQVSCTTKSMELRFRRLAKSDIVATAQALGDPPMEPIALAARLTAKNRLDLPILVSASDRSGSVITDGMLTIHMRRL